MNCCSGRTIRLSPCQRRGIYGPDAQGRYFCWPHASQEAKDAYYASIVSSAEQTRRAALYPELVAALTQVLGFQQHLKGLRYREFIWRDELNAALCNARDVLAKAEGK